VTWLDDGIAVVVAVAAFISGGGRGRWAGDVPGLCPFSDSLLLPLLVLLLPLPATLDCAVLVVAGVVVSSARPRLGLLLCRWWWWWWW